jgi:hypothetical protein
MVIRNVGFKPKYDRAGEDQQLLQMIDPSSSHRGGYIRTKIVSVQLREILVVGLKRLGAETK